MAKIFSFRYANQVSVGDELMINGIDGLESYGWRCEVGVEVGSLGVVEGPVEVESNACNYFDASIKLT